MTENQDIPNPSARLCPKCGEEFRLAWIGYDPPEPYGDVCGCPDGQFAEARLDKVASDRDAISAWNRRAGEA
jgi:hypothetical protein